MQPNTQIQDCMSITSMYPNVLPLINWRKHDNSISNSHTNIACNLSIPPLLLVVQVKLITKERGISTLNSGEQPTSPPTPFTTNILRTFQEPTAYPHHPLPIPSTRWQFTLQWKEKICHICNNHLQLIHRFKTLWASLSCIHICIAREMKIFTNSAYNLHIPPLLLAVQVKLITK